MNWALGAKIMLPFIVLSILLLLLQLVAPQSAFIFYASQVVDYTALIVLFVLISILWVSMLRLLFPNHPRATLGIGLTTGAILFCGFVFFISLFSVLILETLFG